MIQNGLEMFDSNRLTNDDDLITVALVCVWRLPVGCAKRGTLNAVKRICWFSYFFALLPATRAILHIEGGCKAHGRSRVCLGYLSARGRLVLRTIKDSFFASSIQASRYIWLLLKGGLFYCLNWPGEIPHLSKHSNRKIGAAPDTTGERWERELVDNWWCQGLLWFFHLPRLESSGFDRNRFAIRYTVLVLLTLISLFYIVYEQYSKRIILSHG